MSDASKETSVSFDYNTLSDEKISSNFHSWYRRMFGKNPICLYLNLMNHQDKNEFINFDPSDKENSLVSVYETYRDYFPKSEYFDAILVMGLYLKHIKDS